jgi:hypothetical protein
MNAKTQFFTMRHKKTGEEVEISFDAAIDEHGRGAFLFKTHFLAAMKERRMKEREWRAVASRLEGTPVRVDSVQGVE